MILTGNAWSAVMKLNSMNRLINSRFSEVMHVAKYYHMLNAFLGKMHRGEINTFFLNTDNLGGLLAPARYVCESCDHLMQRVYVIYFIHKPFYFFLAHSSSSQPIFDKLLHVKDSPNSHTDHLFNTIEVKLSS